MHATMTTLQITIGLTALVALIAILRSQKAGASRRSAGDGAWSGDGGGDGGHAHGAGDHAGSGHSGGGDSGSDGGGSDGGGGGD